MTPVQSGISVMRGHILLNICRLLSDHKTSMKFDCGSYYVEQRTAVL